MGEDKPSIVACSGQNCGNEFKFGDIVVRGSNGIFCEHCARKQALRGEAVVYGGKQKPSSVQRDRARRNLQKLARMRKRSSSAPADQNVIAPVRTGNE